MKEIKSEQMNDIIETLKIYARGHNWRDTGANRRYRVFNREKPGHGYEPAREILKKLGIKWR